jgi:hypothetical protein
MPTDRESPHTNLNGSATAREYYAPGNDAWAGLEC